MKTAGTEVAQALHDARRAEDALAGAAKGRGRDLVTKGLLQRWAYVAYFAQCLPGQEGVLLEKMKRFASASVPQFQLTTGHRETKVATVHQLGPELATARLGH